MKCPTCNAWTEVLLTRKKATYTYRRYECANLHRFTTREVVLDQTGPSCISIRTGGGTSTEPSGEAKPTKLKTLAMPSGKEKT